MADGSWYPALVGKRSQLTAWPVESVGSKHILHGEISAGLAGGKSPPLEKVRGRRRVVDSLSKCDAPVWEVATGALIASQQPEIEEKRRIVVELPTGLSFILLVPLYCVYSFRRTEGGS